MAGTHTYTENMERFLNKYKIEKVLKFVVIAQK